MWTKSRALAGLQNRLPDAYEVDVEFRKPVLLPTTVSFGSRVNDGVTTFAVNSAKNPPRQVSAGGAPTGSTHLLGRIKPS